MQIRIVNVDDTYNSFRITVPKEFEDIFSHFYFAENNSDEVIKKTLIPSFQTILIFSFGAEASLITQQNNEIKIDKCFAIGTIRQAIDYSLSPHSQILVVNFKNDAFYRFFNNVAMETYFLTHLDALANENSFTSLWCELNEISDVNLKVKYILEFCKPYLQERNPLVEQITGFAENNLNPVKEIAKQNNLSERAIQINHKKYLGYSDKEVSRFRRFAKAIRLIQDIVSEKNKVDWFEIINECNYYDQSQLIHDFKHYMNLTPTKYLKFLQDICNPIT